MAQGAINQKIPYEGAAGHKLHVKPPPRALIVAPTVPLRALGRLLADDCASVEELP